VRWLIFFLLVANVALFFWLQQQSRPAPGSSVLPPPDVGNLRLRHELHRAQASAIDQVAPAAPLSDVATSGRSMAELQHVEQMSRGSHPSAADEAVDVEGLSGQPMPPGATVAPPSAEPSVPAFAASTPPQTRSAESLSDGSAGLSARPQIGSTELSSPQQADPLDPMRRESVGPSESSPSALIESTDPAPEDPEQTGRVESLAEQPERSTELAPQESAGPAGPMPRESVAPTAPVSAGQAGPLLLEALAPIGTVDREQAEPDQPLTQEQAIATGVGQMQGRLEPGSGSAPPMLSTEDPIEGADAETSDGEPAQTNPAAPASGDAALVVCARVGPLEAQGAESLVANLPTHITLQSDVAEEYTDVTGYYVLIPPLASRAEGIRKLRELREAGVDDIWLFRSGEFNNAISLGLFSREQTARRHATNVAKKGFAAEIRNRTSIRERRWLELAYTDGVDLAAAVPLPEGATVMPMPCP
jgi:hypothetical protein